MHKSIKNVVLAALVLLMLSIGTCVSAGALGLGVVADEDTLNVRSGPGTDYSVITALPFGAIVDLEELNNGWYYIRWGNNRGWCAGNRIAQYEYIGRDGYINSPDSNMRSGPSSNARLIEVFGQGARIKVVGRSLGWYYVASGNTGEYGWVYGGYVSF